MNPWPIPLVQSETAAMWWRALTMQDYNTRVVAAGVALLGAACGVVGAFMILRRKALFGDAISHATLPGVALAFLMASALGIPGKQYPILLAGAVCTALLGMGVIAIIRRFTRLPEDAALGIVLSVFFGAGVVLLGVIQQMEGASAAGLESFIYGKTASMLAEDGRRIAICAAVLAALCALLFKEFRLLCFDPDFARAQGWPVRGLDAAMLGMAVAATVIGLQAAGLLLVVALMIVPPAAARFWTDDLRAMALTAAAIGAGAGVLGALWSAMEPDWPAGAVIVLVAAAAFALSFLFGRSRGVVYRLAAHARLERRVDRLHLLRAFYEASERERDEAALSASDLARSGFVPPRRLARALRRLAREGALERLPDKRWRLTSAGRALAARVVRNHRLWEMYLIRHAAIAPTHADRDADMIEHVLGREMVAELERDLEAADAAAARLESPHPIARVGERP
jgi:manganese/zinc/iron transport system permease protein